MAVRICGVSCGSPADKAGISSGDSLLSINGNEIVDVLDYRFYQTGTLLMLELTDMRGTAYSVSVKKPEYDELGLEFETYLMDQKHSCKNKCVFCFIDQLPKGMRDTLYFKDDDSRLSFLFGNYITLTNLTEHEISRIIKLHISPVNVSVHTTNPQLRSKMMNNRFAGEKLEILKRFADAGIKINCQIVCCPGLNDGEELRKTLNDLAVMYPSVECIAAVPVGLTGHREGLYELQPYTKETAAETLDILEKFGDAFYKEHGTRLAFAADEFYIKAGRKIPDADFYEEFEQLENGVGMISLMRDEFLTALEFDEYDFKAPRRITCAGGTSAKPFMEELYKKAEQKYNGLNVTAVAIENRFFGGGVNVSGLVTGRDLIDQLKGKDLGDELLIPSVMLRREGDMFLDNVTLADVERELDIKVTPVENDGSKLLCAVLGV